MKLIELTGIAEFDVLLRKPRAKEFVRYFINPSSIISVNREIVDTEDRGKIQTTRLIAGTKTYFVQESPRVIQNRIRDL